MSIVLIVACSVLFVGCVVLAIILIHTTLKFKPHTAQKEYVFSVGDKKSTIRLTKAEAAGVKNTVAQFVYENDVKDMSFQKLKIL